MFWPCETRTTTCRSFATISSGLYRFLAITVLLDVKDIPQVGPLQWGRIRVCNLPRRTPGRPTEYRLLAPNEPKLRRVDRWAASQKDDPSRPNAIRRLVEL